MAPEKRYPSSAFIAGSRYGYRAASGRAGRTSGDRRSHPLLRSLRPGIGVRRRWCERCPGNRKLSLRHPQGLRGIHRQEHESDRDPSTPRELWKPKERSMDGVIPRERTRSMHEPPCLIETAFQNEAVIMGIHGGVAAAHRQPVRKHQPIGKPKPSQF